MSAPETLAPPGEARERPRSYHGRPVIKEPVWTWEIPFYFFAGGLGGASAGLAWLAELRGSEVLARRAWALALAGIGISPALLISDLGRPARFLNMLRMLKVTSPMSVGSWLLSACGAATALAAADSLLPRRLRRRLPAPARRALAAGARPARPAAAALGLPVSTYTAALVANTAVPVWHEARLTLPFLFGGGAAASAGAAAVAAVPPGHAAPARRACVTGALMEVVAAKAMEQRLGELARPYHEGAAGRFNRLGDAMTSTGAMVVAAFGRRRTPAAAGAALVLAGALSKRWAVFRAGFQSAADPAQTVGPQRERIRSGATRGAERVAGG